MTTSDATPDSKPPVGVKKPKKPGRWRRRFIWTLGLLIILGFVLRGVLPLALPAVMRKVAGQFGLTVTYDRLELNLFSGDAGIWNLQFAPAEGGDAILTAEYCHGNVSVADLFKGKLNVWRVEADGVEVTIDRNTDGHIPLLDRLVRATTPKTPATPVKTGNGPGKTGNGPVDLSAPLRIDALRLSHIHVHLHDRGVSPEIDTELAMDLRLSDLGSTSTLTKFEMNLSADPILDSMQVRGEGKSGGKNLDAKFTVLVRGIRLKPAEAYLAPLGIRPVSDAITLRAEGHVHTEAAPGGAEGFTGSAEFDRMSVTADREVAASLDRLVVNAGTIDTKSIRINDVMLDGARASAGRGSDGNLRAAGIEYDPKLVAAAAPAKTAATATSQPAAPVVSSVVAEHWSIGKVTLHNARLDLHDEAVTPAVDLAFVADDLSAKSIDHDPKNLNTSVTLAGLLHAPGLVADIALDGSATPFAETKKLSGTVTATGIRPDAVRPYLDLIGLESTLKNGRFSAAMDASVSLSGRQPTAGLALTKLDFRDDVPLVSLAGFTVSDAKMNLDSGAITVADVEIAGPGLAIARDAKGRLKALGLRTKPASAPAPSPGTTGGSSIAGRGEGDSGDQVVSADPNHPRPNPRPKALPEYRERGPEKTLGSLPKITVAKFGWKDVRVELEDQSATPSVKVVLSNLGVDATDITTDLTRTRPGHFAAFFESAGIAKHLAASGDLTPRADGLKLVATVTGDGLNTTSFAPYLKPFGIEPVLKDGGLTLTADADVKQTAAGITASMALKHLKYTDGPVELAAVDDLKLKGLSLKDGEIGVASIAIVRPHLTARRDADGSLVAGGIRLLPASERVAASAAAVTPAAAVAPVAADAPVVKSVEPKPVVVSVKSLSVTDAQIGWNDLAVKPPVAVTAGASVDLQNLTLGKDADPADLKLSAHVEGSLDSATVAGKISDAPSRQTATLDITAAGLRAGPLASYLPPGVALSLRDGRFHTTIDAAVTKNPAGGIGAQLVVGPLDFRDTADGPAAPPLLAMDSARVIVPRIDLPLNALAVDEISVAGVRTHAERTAANDIACAGLVFGGKPTAGVPVAPAVPAAVAPAEHGLETRATADVPAGPTAAELVAASHRVLPTVTVGKLDLNVASLTLTDLDRPASSPLVVTDLRLHNTKPVDCLGKEAAIKPPVELEFTCRALPIVDHVGVTAAVSPFAHEPKLKLDFEATGIHGAGLTDLVPELKEQLDGSTMDAGCATAHFAAEANLDRRSPVDFDVSHGFDLSFVLGKVQYRAKPDGPVLAGVDEVRSEKIRVAPADSVVHFKTLEITRPIGLVVQDDKGIHLLGWVYKLPAKAAPATTAPATLVMASAAGAQPAVEVPPSPPVEKPKGDISIDKLLISGLDFRVEDNAFDPPLVIPLNELDVEVRHLSSLCPYEDRPIRFSAVVSADKVKLKKKGTDELEDRDLFSQITANGDVSLYPRLHGWAKTSVSGLELAELDGPARKYGENLTAGLYDSTVDLRFDPDGAIAVTSKFTLTDLSLSEPHDGPIRRLLNLSVPLDVAIGAVQDADGSISLPVNVSVDPKHISYTDLGLAAAGGVSQVIVTAIAAAPLKAANDVLGMVGIGGGSKQPENLTTKITFSPASAAIGADQTASLTPLLKQLSDDSKLTVTLRNQIGVGDVAIARLRANPTKDQCNALESQLRSRKEELLTLRADTAGRARAQLMSLGSTPAGPVLEQLRAIDRELAATEESLDQVGELLRPGAERLAERRTKAAALEISRQRMKSLQSTLQAAGIAADRIKVINPTFNPAKELDGGVVTLTAVHTK
jgi:hypothetical protein